MEYVIGGLALLFVLCVVLGVLATVKAVKAVHRGVRRTGRQVRRAADEVSLRAKSAQPGPVGELARIRLSLRNSLSATRQALRAEADTDGSLRETLALLDQLAGHARQLDGELRLLMEEPDRRRVEARLPEARERAARLRRSADSLRWAAQDRARRLDEESLATLDEQIRLETTALRHWEPGETGEDATGRASPGASRHTTRQAADHSAPDVAGTTSATASADTTDDPPAGAARPGTSQAALPQADRRADPLADYLGGSSAAAEERRASPEPGAT